MEREMIGQGDFIVSFERVNYHRPLNGHVAEVLSARKQEIRNNLLRYLGEYRLAVKFDEFYYTEGISPTGERFLRTEENAPIIEIFRRGIYKKQMEGNSPKREVAECLGFQKIEEAYLRGEDFIFLWISPPGRKEDGYGDYSFTFVGEVKDKKIRAVPYRNKLSIEQHREISSLFSEEANSLETDVDFLANPVFMQKKKGLENVEDVLLKIGEKEKIDLSWRERLKKRVGGMMDMFVEAVKINAPDSELERIKRAMENYTIDKKEEIANGAFVNAFEELGIRKIVDEYGSYAPSPVAGSCPKSSSKTLMEFHKDRGYEFDHEGTCAVCNSGPKRLGPCEICEECVVKIEKEEELGIAA